MSKTIICDICGRTYDDSHVISPSMFRFKRYGYRLFHKIEYAELTDFDICSCRLKELQKNKKGNATSDAKMAQKILWERNGNGFNTDLCNRACGSKHFASPDRMNGYK